MVDWERGTIAVQSVTLHYARTGGHNPPIVLAHGITDSGAQWEDLAEALSETWDVVTYDARGHGSSDKPAGDYSAADHAADLLALIDALGLRQPVLLGHSMGGATVAHAAAAAPDIVRAVILEDPAFTAPGRPVLALPGDTWAADWRARLDVYKSNTPADLRVAGRAEHPLWPEAQIEHWATAKQQLDPVVLDWLYAPQTAWRELLAHISCPTLVVIGEPALGGIVSLDVATEMVAVLPHGQVAQIQGAGHSIRREQFEHYRDAVLAFLWEL